jgi:hypothetical protein
MFEKMQAKLEESSWCGDEPPVPEQVIHSVLNSNTVPLRDGKAETIMVKEREDKGS